ncbi:MAG: GNAT family N-acetyltransferase [Chloroflexota bacterium]|nr:GNAT family N-acetyltransferase [Chloroflexota bacterium]
MAIREMHASGRDYLARVTELLQRVRLADPHAGLWEAADLQWWWRTPRRSDAIEQPFWADDDGPVAAAILTDWGTRWGCDPIIVPCAVPLSVVWERAMESVSELGLDHVEVLARDDDAALLELLARSGFVRDDDEAGNCWRSADDPIRQASPPPGLQIIDRQQLAVGPHPMSRRSGPAVEARLRECSLYDPALDLAALAQDGTVAGYALFWVDPVTRVGLVEPMRVEEAYQRRGLARALLTAGLDRLVRRGAERLKVGYGTDAARRLYLSAGFRLTSTARTYRLVRRRAREASSSDVSPVSAK